MQRGNTSYFDFDIVLDELQVPTNEQLVLTPVIENNIGEQLKLAEVIINSKRCHNLHKRMERLSGINQPSKRIRNPRLQVRHIMPNG